MAAFARKEDSRFYPFWAIVGSVARFVYRLRHRDWCDHIPPPEPPLAQIVEKFDGPVYGLIDDFMGLIPDGRSYGSREIGLNYQTDWLGSEQAKPGVCIETRKGSDSSAPWPWIGLELKLAAFGAAWEFSSQSFRDREIATFYEPHELMDRFPSEAIPTVPLNIPEFPAATTVWRWSIPEPVHVAVLRSDSMKSTLSTFGLILEQPQELSRHIGPLNDRPDLMLKYRELSRHIGPLNDRPDLMLKYREQAARVKHYQLRLTGSYP